MGRAPRTQDDFSRAVISELFAAMPDGISIREVGRRAEMSHSQLSRIKNGERVLDVDQLEKLATVAGVSPHVIVDRAEKAVKGATERSNVTPIKRRPPTEADFQSGRAAALREDKGDDV